MKEMMKNKMENINGNVICPWEEGMWPLVRTPKWEEDEYGFLARFVPTSLMNLGRG